MLLWVYIEQRPAAHVHVARRSHTVEYREHNRSRGARPSSAHPVRRHHCSQIRRQLGGGDLCVVAEALEQQQHGGDLGRVVERPGRLREGGVQLRAHVLVEEREVAQRVLAVELAEQRGDARGEGRAVERVGGGAAQRAAERGEPLLVRLRGLGLGLGG